MAKSILNTKEQASASPWMYGPWLDLIVGCGAWSAPLLLLSYFSLSSSARTWSLAFYGLALLFNYPHYMATIYRAYYRAEDFHKYRIFTVHTTALIVLTLVLAHSWPRVLPWIFTIYLTWSPWHYSGQNYGLFMMFARRAGAQPTTIERRALYGAFVVSYLILFLGFHTGTSGDPLFVSLGIPAVVSRWEQVVLCVGFVGLSGFGLSRLARVTGWRNLLPSLTLFSSQILWFLLPSALSLAKGWAIPQSRYSSGILAVMHSAQYLWITSYYARREATNEGGRRWHGLGYFAALVAGGIALFVPGPWLASRVLHLDFTVSFLIFTALVNIHHFILDGAIWKLRDGRIAALLLNSREQITSGMASAGGLVASVWQWMTGESRAAHYARVSAAVALLAWGSVDQVRYYYALHAENTADLERAAALNAYDSSLQMRIGQRQMSDGLPVLAEVAWKKAMEANPTDPAPRQALLRLLIDANRFDEARQLTDASLKYAPNDPNLLVDRGLLALRGGHADTAMSDWNQAIAMDSNQLLPHLYLANELDREGKAAPAAAHYNSFLQRIAREPAEKRFSPDKVIAIVLRMADCQSRALQNDAALKSYHLAETLASQTGQVKLESLAEVNEAALQSKAGHVGEALQLYQAALQKDEASGDRTAGASDWYAYGSFLAEQGFPARLAYACFLQSGRVAENSSDANFAQSLTAAKNDVRKRLGADAGPVEHNLERLLREVLTLRQ